MQVNPFLLFSGLGMITIGFSPILYWWRVKKAQFRYFAFGGVAWLAAILVKGLMDLTVSNGLYGFIHSLYSENIFLLLTGLYIGLRTGLLENFFQYVFVLKTKLRKGLFNESFAFGLGFGCTEAFLLGVGSFINLLMFILFPEIINYVPEQQRQAVLKQLTMSTWVVFAPIIERGSAILIHLFSTLLVVLSVRKAERFFLLAAVLYKTILDGSIPFLRANVNTLTLTGIYLIEVFITILGVIGLIGVLQISRKKMLV